MKIKPLDDRVVVKQSEAKEKTSGGIYLPETAKEKPMMGTVAATGPGRLLDNDVFACVHAVNGNRCHDFSAHDNVDNVEFHRFQHLSVVLEGTGYAVFLDYGLHPGPVQFSDCFNADIIQTTNARVVGAPRASTGPDKSCLQHVRLVLSGVTLACPPYPEETMR